MKYLVMESADTYAVLLDEDGRFVKSANLGYEVGDTVQHPTLMRDKPLEKIKEKPRRLNKVMTTIVALAAVITIFFGRNYYQENMTPYSSIFMAINPEVEMVLNKNGDVLELKGTNKDGKALIEDYKISSKNKTVVANELVDRAIDMGFLAEGGRVSIAIDTPDQALFEEYGIELRRELDGRISIMIEITDMENRNQKPAEPVEKVPVPEDDSGYDDSSYDESPYKEPVETPAPKLKPETPKPVAPAPKPKPKPVPPPKHTDDDSDYDDTDYDESAYDDDDSDTDYDDDDDSDYDDDADDD